MKTLITGATGFVGRQVFRTLLQRGHPIKAVVRPSSMEDAELQHELVEMISTEDCFSESEGWWSDACIGVEGIIHLAWYVNPRDYLVSDNNTNCLSGTIAMARGAVDAGVRRFVGVGTCFEYDLSSGTLDIQTPIQPKTPYAVAKAATCSNLATLFGKRGVSFAWCRLFYLHGEGEHPQRLAMYVRNQLESGEEVMLTKGTQVRDFMDVSDAGREIVDVLDSSIEGPVNVCSGSGVTVREFVEAIADEYGRRDLLRFGARPDNLIDPPVVVGVR